MSTLGEKKTDRRVLRTKRNIRNAFLRLLAQKEMDKITIKEIAAEADVDRKTVYNYYTSVQSILEELENELVQNFEKALSKMNFGSMEKGMMAFHTLTELIEENLEVYGLLMKLDGHSRLMSKIKIYLKEKAREVIQDMHLNPEKVEIVVEFVTSGMFMAYRYWFNSDRQESLNDFTKDIMRLVMNGVVKYFQEE
ncbi:MAG: TetR/AcrR family transcriptional regulator [Clostridia bacterium]|nr:TetR/AcrR family transcriptional regulator [Clostridia bacterium]